MKAETLLNKPQRTLRVDGSGIQLINKSAIAAAKKVARAKTVTEIECCSSEGQFLPSVSYKETRIGGGGGFIPMGLKFT